MEQLAGRLRGDAALTGSLADGLVGRHGAGRGLGSVGTGAASLAAVDLVDQVSASLQDLGRRVATVAAAFAAADGAAGQLPGADAGTFAGTGRFTTKARKGVGSRPSAAVEAMVDASQALIAARLAAGAAVPAWMLKPDPSTGRPRQFLHLSFEGDGQAIELFGDPGAASIGVLIPGRGTTLDGFDGLAADARRLRAVAGPEDVAMIAWLGYDAPDSGLDPSTLTDGRARAGGMSLNVFLRSLHLGDGQRLTLVGHSYGSLLAGQAVLAADLADRTDLVPDALVLLGSPGVGVDHRSELPWEMEAYTIGNRWDLVARSGWFGANPNGGDSGFARLDSDTTGHSSYLDPASLSLTNTAAIVAGRPCTATRVWSGSALYQLIAGHVWDLSCEDGATWPPLP